MESHFMSLVGGNKIVNCRFNNILSFKIQWIILKIKSDSNLEEQAHGKGSFEVGGYLDYFSY